jgi:prepilin-type N-terminal cleavage/methylation domain-containing protein
MYTTTPSRIAVTAAARRSGVTLIELMVVLIVISILSALMMSGLIVARSNATSAKTASTIRKLHEVIIPYYEDYQTRRPALGDTTALLTLTNGRTCLNDLKRIAIRRLMTLELPERPEDVTESLVTAANGGFLPYAKTYVGVTCKLDEVPPVARRYRSIITSLPAGQVANNAELLHLIVTRGPVADADVIAHFRPDEVADVDKDGLQEFVDGWGKPIQFRRWPTGFASPAQPIDGTRRTIDSWFSDRGHRLVPLIFSAGPDGVYDIELMPGNPPRTPPLIYSQFDFDPFCFYPATPTASPILDPETRDRVRGEVVLTPVVRPGSGPLTFFATRLDSSLQVTPPPLEDDCTPRPNDSFFTVGAERDIESVDGGVPNGRVESLDNVHNHDLTR